MNPHTPYALIAYADRDGFRFVRPLPVRTFAHIYQQSEGARAAVALAEPGVVYAFDLYDVLMLGEAPFVAPGAYRIFPRRSMAVARAAKLAEAA